MTTTGWMWHEVEVPSPRNNCVDIMRGVGRERDG